MTKGRQYVTLAVLATALFAYSISGAMVSPAVPVIQHAVGSSEAAVAWALGGIELGGAVLAPLISRLADVRDKRVVLIGLLIVCGLGMFCSATATTPTQIMIGQLVQGAGLGMVPVSVGIIADIMPEEWVKTGNGVIMGIATASTALGMVVGGPLVDATSFRMVFALPGVLVILSAIAAWLFVPPCKPMVRGKSDLLGAMLLGAALLALLQAITRSADFGWGSPVVLGLLGITVASLIAFVIVELRVAEPLLDLQLLAGRAVSLTCVVALASGFTCMAPLLVVPYIVESPVNTGYGLGQSATMTGLYLVPLGVLGAIASPLAGRLERSIGARGVMTLGTITMVLGALPLFAANSQPWLLFVASGITGVMMGFAMTGAMNIIVTVVPEERVASVTGLAFVMNAVGASLGAQVCGSVIAASGSSWDGFENAFWITALIGVAAVLAGLFLPRHIGARASRSDSRTIPLPAQKVLAEDH